MGRGAFNSAWRPLRHKQGRHLGRMETLGFDLRSEANLTALTDEVVTSSAIEGEKLSTDEVRSSIARQLGLEVAGLKLGTDFRPSREVDGVVEMMIDATRNSSAPLTTAKFDTYLELLYSPCRSCVYHWAAWWVARWPRAIAYLYRPPILQ